jgi:hypothetical protein
MDGDFQPEGAYCPGMTLHFPNPSRSYDPNHHRVRFWGHDESREVAFLVEAEALRQLDGAKPNDEDGLLETFDANRDRIEGAARKAYTRRGSGFYVLAAADI